MCWQIIVMGVGWKLDSYSVWMQIVVKIVCRIVRVQTAPKGLSTRVRICVRIAVRFRARFVSKQNREPIIFLLAIAMVGLHISAKKNKKQTLLDTLGSKSYTES
jgi:hypothetical protein